MQRNVVRSMVTDCSIAGGQGGAKGLSAQSIIHDVMTPDQLCTPLVHAGQQSNTCEVLRLSHLEGR